MMGTSIASNFTGFSGGFLMSIIAFSTVFLVILGLMLMMMGLKAFATSVERSEKAKEAAKAAPAPAASSAPSAPTAAVAAVDDGELIAVITAAVSAMCGRAARVVSFAPVAAAGGSSAWKMTGILQNTEGFLD